MQLEYNKNKSELIPVYPIKISNNRRYLVDQENNPFLFHADTGWKLFWEFTKSEAEVYLNDRKQKGFTVIQVQLLPHRDYQANRNGDNPFLKRGDITDPNPAYFEHVDWVISKAMEIGLGMLIAPAWASNWEQDWHTHLNSENAEIFADFIANRYKNHLNIIGWIHGGDYDALELHDAIRICGRVIKKIAPHQLNTFHGYIKGGGQYFHNESWYDLNMAYAYDYNDMVIQLNEAYELLPVKPVFLGETHYEYNLGITTADIRKYAWTSILLGTAGQTYGNKDIWIATCFWTAAINSPGAANMLNIKNMLDTLDWEKLVPDKTNAVVTKVCDSSDHIIPASCSEDGSIAIAYIPSDIRIAVDTKRLAPDIQAFWFDTTNGTYIEIGDINDLIETELKTPGKNSSGDEDWVLLFKK